MEMKIQALEELPDMLRGKRVVLANGCFDILHVGHVRYLRGARQWAMRWSSRSTATVPSGQSKGQNGRF
jgi:bifunctional ADP-heptose synthase (sugar kinase/adenylyltransferase)